MKTKEELNALKEEVETESRKLHELTDEELAQVSGGLAPDVILEPAIDSTDVEPPVIEPPAPTGRPSYDRRVGG